MIIGIPRFTLFMQGHTKNWGSKSHVNQDYILLSSTKGEENRIEL